MGHASELKARTQTCGGSQRHLCLRCSPRSRSSSSTRDFWQLITWLWSATLLTRPIWPLMIPSVPTMTLKFWNIRLPSHTSFQKVKFQRCFQERQKCWTCRINSEWDDDDEDKNDATTTTTNYKARRIVSYRLNPETFGNTPQVLKNTQHR